MFMNIFYKLGKYSNGDKMRLKEIFNKGLISADIKASIYDVANLMKKHNIGFVPITNNQSIVGVITDRDIVINAIANNCDCNHYVEDYINKNIIKIDYNREIHDALSLMKQHKIKRIIVMDGEKIVGVLSLSDIIKTNEKEVLDTIKTIWTIDDKNRLKDAKIDEFYL